MRGRRAFAATIILAVLALVAVQSVNVYAQSLTPFDYCYTEPSSGNFSVEWGYTSTYSSAEFVAVGSGNFFSPAPANRGQTTIFNPGTVNSAFTASTTSGTPITWNLLGNSATFDPSNPNVPPCFGTTITTTIYTTIYPPTVTITVTLTITVSSTVTKTVTVTAAGVSPAPYGSRATIGGRILPTNLVQLLSPWIVLIAVLSAISVWMLILKRERATKRFVTAIQNEFLGTSPSFTRDQTGSHSQGWCSPEGYLQVGGT